MKINLKWFIGLGIIGVAIAATQSLNFGNNLVYFYTPVEAFIKAPALANKTIRVGGMVKEGTLNVRRDNSYIEFVLTDMKGNDIQVHYKGIPPDMFKPKQGVVVEGRLEKNGRFMLAYKLMVKHSEEYKKPDEYMSIDEELLKKSIFKD